MADRHLRLLSWPLVGEMEKSVDLDAQDTWENGLEGVLWAGSLFAPDSSMGSYLSRMLISLASQVEFLILKVMMLRCKGL